MDGQQSRDELRCELRTELVRRGLPRAYIERLLSELDDHFTDLLEERNSAMGAARKLHIEPDDLQQRLGDPTQLAIFAAEQYHARTFWGRHPILTYLLGPLPLLVACWIVCGLVLWAFLWSVALTGHYAFGLTEEFFRPEDHLFVQAITLALVSWYVMVLPPLAAAELLCRTYRRNALDWRLARPRLHLASDRRRHFSIRGSTGHRPHPSRTRQGHVRLQRRHIRELAGRLLSPQVRRRSVHRLATHQTRPPPTRTRNLKPPLAPVEDSPWQGEGQDEGQRVAPIAPIGAAQPQGATEVYSSRSA